MKKIFGFLILAVLAFVAYSGSKKLETSSNASLASIMHLNTADAECRESSVTQMNTGGCGVSGNCFPMRPIGERCDPTLGR